MPQTVANGATYVMVFADASNVPALVLTGTLRGDLPSFSVPTHDVTPLSNVGFSQKIFGKTIEHTAFSLDLDWNPVVAEKMAEHLTPATKMLGRLGTITVTLPKLVAASTNGATIVGTGAVTSYSLPSLASNQPMQGRISMEFNGVTGPALTNEA